MTDSLKQPGQAGTEDEIEITPEMVEAGLAELVAFDPEYDEGQDFVRRVFRAMEAARFREQVEARESSVSLP